jgi:hypothetical protein
VWSTVPVPGVARQPSFNLAKGFWPSSKYRAGVCVIWSFKKGLSTLTMNTRPSLDFASIFAVSRHMA